MSWGLDWNTSFNSHFGSEQPDGSALRARRQLGVQSTQVFSELSSVYASSSTGIDTAYCLNAGGMGRRGFETETLITDSLYMDVVFITAGADRFNVPAYVTYGACKGAIEVLSRYVAKEYGPRGIRSNSVAPGGIVTDFNDAASAAIHRRSSGSSLRLP